MEGEGICRTCLKTTDKLMPLFGTPLLVFKIVAIAPVEIFSNDNLPQTICEECCKSVDGFFNFKEMIINNGTILKRRYVEPPAEVLYGKVNDDESSDPNFFEPLHIKSELIEQFTTQENTSNVLECIGNNTDCVDVLPKREDNLIKTAEATNNSMTICSSCGELIRCNSLNRHVRLHCENPVNCRKCGKIMKNKHFLKTHLRSVHKKVPYHCKGCNRDFAVYKDFQKHTSRCHLKNNRKLKKDAQQNRNNRNQKTTSAKSAHANCTYVCNACGKSCNSKKLLHKHKKLRHGDGKKIFCLYCSKALPSQKALKTHVCYRTN